MIRIALKETYTSTNEQIKQYENEISAIEEQYIESQSSSIDNGQIIGPSTVESFDVVKYSIVGLKDENTAAAAWEISQGAPVKILSQTGKELKLEIGQIRGQVSFDIDYIGTEGLHDIVVKPFI